MDCSYTRKGPATHYSNYHLGLDAFSWEEYLSFQLLKRGISPKSREEYLRHDLGTIIRSDESVVPQAKS